MPSPRPNRSPCLSSHGPIINCRPCAVRALPACSPAAFLEPDGAFVDSTRFKAEPSSASVLSPPLLACVHDFAHVPCRPNLEKSAKRQRRMPADQLYSMVHVPRLKDKNAADLFLGFRIGTVGRCHFAV